MKISKVALVVLTTGLSLFTPCLSSQDGPVLSPQLGEPHHQAQFNALLSSNFEYWDNGYLITFGRDGTLETTPSSAAVVLYDKDGNVAREAVVWFDGAEIVNVSGAAVAASGQLVVSGVTVNHQGVMATYIAEIGSNNRVGRVVRTAPFSTKYLCVVNDGTVWSYGLDRDEHLNNIQSSLRLRHYSFDKGQLQALLDTSSLNQANEAWLLERGRYPNEINFRCNSKTVVLYNAASGELIEVDLKTNALRVTKVAALPDPPEFHISGFALTESGEIFASFYDRSRKPVVSGLFRISRDNAGSAKWVPVEGTVGSYLRGSPIHHLQGADGDDLVYTRLNDGRVFWSTPNTH